MIDSEQLVEECLGDVLRRHQEEIKGLEAQLAEVQGLKLSIPEAKQHYIEEVRRLEFHLAALQQRHHPAWLHGPASSIEHEVARRRHFGEVQRIEAALVSARLRLERLGLSMLVGRQGAPVSEPVHVVGCTAPTAWEAWTSAAPVSMDGSAIGFDENAVPSQRLAKGPPDLGPPLCSVLSQPPATFPDASAEIAPEHVVVERRRRFGDWLFRLWVEDCALRHGIRVHAMDVVSLAQTYADLCDEDLQAMYNHFVHRRRALARRRWTAFEACPVSDADHDQELQDFLVCLLDTAYFELDEGRDTLELRLPKRVDPPLSERQAHDVIDVGSKKDSDLSVQWIRERILVPRSVLTESRLKQRLAMTSTMTSCPSQRCAGSLDRSTRGSEQAASSSRPRSAQSARQVSGSRPPVQDFTPYAVPPWQPPAVASQSRPHSASSSGKVRAASACGANTSREAGKKRPSSARGPRKPSAPSATSTTSRRPSSRGRRLEVSEASSPGCCSVPDVDCSTMRPSSHNGGSLTIEYDRPMDMHGQLQASGNPICETSKQGSVQRSDARVAHNAKSASFLRQRLPRPSSAKALKHKRVADSYEQPSVYEDTEASICGDVEGLRCEQAPGVAEQASELGACRWSKTVPVSWQQPLGEPRQSTPPPRR